MNIFITTCESIFDQSILGYNRIYFYIIKSSQNNTLIWEDDNMIMIQKDIFQVTKLAVKFDRHIIQYTSYF